MTGTAAAQAPQVKDFAVQREILTGGSSPIQRFQLPASVYEATTSPFLSDLRIFNGDGNVVPFEIRDIFGTIRDEEQHTALPVFPIEWTTATGNAIDSEVTLSQDPSGRIISVKFLGADTQHPSTTPHYLVDLRASQARIESLRFEWEGAAQLVPVTVESSNDLKSWTTVGSGVLARLQYMGHSVTQNTIDCTVYGAKYLKISAPAGVALTVTGIEALHRETDTVVPSPILRSVTGTAVDAKTFLFDAGGIFPVSSFKIQLPQQNTLAHLILSSRPDEKSRWTERLSTTAYSLAINGGIAQSGFSPFASTISDRYWRVESAEAEITLPSAPTLEFRWYPKQVIFLAQGRGPFSVAYGSVAYRHLPYTGNSVHDLAGALKVTPADSTLGAEQVAGGAGALRPIPARRTVAWRKWVLWGVLTLVLLFILRIARDLLSELGTTRHEQ
jgi:hypothetical protein